MVRKADGLTSMVQYMQRSRVILNEKIRDVYISDDVPYSACCACDQTNLPIEDIEKVACYWSSVRYPKTFENIDDERDDEIKFAEIIF